MGDIFPHCCRDGSVYYEYVALKFRSSLYPLTVICTLFYILNFHDALNFEFYRVSKRDCEAQEVSTYTEEVKQYIVTVNGNVFSQC